MQALPAKKAWGLAAGAAVGVGLLAGVAVIVFATLTAFFDNPRRLDDHKVIALVRSECATMRSTVDSLADSTKDETTDDRLVALEDQNLAVERMVLRLASVPTEVRDGDKPLDAWLTDWEALVTARRAYIKRASEGYEANFKVPISGHDKPITDRMDSAARGVCQVPPVLLDPDALGGQEA